MDAANIGISLSRKYAKAALSDVIPMVREAGFTAISPLWGTKIDMEAVCAQARSLGLYVQSLHAPFGKTDTLWSDDPSVYETGFCLVMRALDDCIRLDIPIMVMHAWIDEDLSFDMDDLYFGNFDAIVEKAAAHGIQIAFENTEGEEYLFALMEHYKDNPSVGYCWDSGHEKCYNHDMDLLAKFGDRLLVTHLNDNLGISDPGGEITYLDDLHLLPYDGVIDWDYNLSRLNKSRPLCCLNFELNLASKPGRHENDIYAQMSLPDYFRLAYERAAKIAEKYAVRCNPMNILFVGNSYTYFNDLEHLVQELCRENGKQVNAYRVTKGGRKLEAYMDPEDETTQKLEAMLRERHYDVCFIQEQSMLPILNYDAFLSGVTHVKRMVGKQADRFVLYATWGRKLGSPDLEIHGWTPESMTRLLEDAYNKAGQQLGIPVSPVGTSFWNVIQDHPEPDLHHTDLTHPSYLGSCLAALTHYHTLFGHFPENTKSLNLTDEQLAVFRTAVCE